MHLPHLYHNPEAGYVHLQCMCLLFPCIPSFPGAQPGNEGIPCSKCTTHVYLFQHMQHKSFYRKLAKSLQLDAGTAEILSGEFAEEAILVKAEQLTRHEVSDKSIS